MTLYRQLVLFVLILCFSLLAGSFVVTVLNARHAVEEQLSVHAQDTATSLALSLQPAVSLNDMVLAGRMIDAIFDGGYYSSILLARPDGSTVVLRHNPVVMEDVPSWFIALIPLQPPAVQSDVSGGWQIAARLTIVSHPGIAYRDLWRTARAEFWLFLITTVLVCILAGVALYWLLRPLKEVEEQAEAVCRRDFRIQPRLPHTRELRNVVQAMNRMTLRLKGIFEEMVQLGDQLRDRAYRDPVTGLSNQNFFDVRYAAMLSSPEERSWGSLMVLQLADFAHYNRLNGRDAGDLLLQQVASVWDRVPGAYPDALVARRMGADFIAHIPGVPRVEGDLLMQQVFASVSALSYMHQGVEPVVFHMGMAWCDADDNAGELMSRAQFALRVAQTRGESGCYAVHGVTRTDASAAALGRSIDEWREVLSEALAQDRILLYFQPVFDPGRHLLHREVLARLQLDDEVLPAGVFIPLVERFGLEQQLDLMIVRKTLSLIEDMQLLRAENTGTRFSINLSPHSLKQSFFAEELLSLLQAYPEHAQYLWFEVPEYAVNMVPEAVRRLALELSMLGSGLVLDHFGAYGVNLSYLGSLPVVALKIDQSFIRDIVANSDHQFLVQSLRYVAHSRDALLLAENIESEEQWSRLRELRVDGGQGFLFGLPQQTL